MTIICSKVCVYSQLDYTLIIEYNIDTARETELNKTGQEVRKMENDMTVKEIDKLFDWLIAKGHTAEECTECIKYIATKEKAPEEPNKHSEA